MSMSKALDPKCPVARTLDIVGERWTILVLRDLFLFGPRRFQDLQNSLSRMAPNTLSARIKTLEDEGIIESRQYSDHPPSSEYALTAKGLALQPALLALRDWGEKYTDGPRAPRGPLSPPDRPLD